MIPRKRGRGRPPAARRQRPAIERKFAEMKCFHGLAKVTIQCLLTAIVGNCERLVAVAREAAGGCTLPLGAPGG